MTQSYASHPSPHATSKQDGRSVNFEPSVGSRPWLSCELSGAQLRHLDMAFAFLELEPPREFTIRVTWVKEPPFEPLVMEELAYLGFGPLR